MMRFRASGAPTSPLVLGAVGFDSTRVHALLLSLVLFVFLVLPGLAGGTPAAGPGGTIAVSAGASARTIYLVSPASATTRKVVAPDDVVRADLSTDGRRIAVAGLTGIWVMQRNGSRARRIFDTRSLKFGAGDVAWSPDGRRLAFVRRDSLFTISADGKSVKKLTSHADAPDWSPNGTQIVFIFNPDLSSRDGTISAIRTDGRGLHRIIASGKWYGPRVSPDGSKLAFYRNGIPGIFVAAEKGGRARLFLRNGSHPAWSPDGRFLAFTRDVNCSGAVCRSRIFIIPAAGGKASPYGPVLADIGPLSWTR